MGKSESEIVWTVEIDETLPVARVYARIEIVPPDGDEESDWLECAYSKPTSI